MSLARGQHQRGLSAILDRVDVGAGGQQGRHHGGVAIDRRRAQRCEMGIGGGVHVGTRCDRGAQGGEVAGHRRLEQLTGCRVVRRLG